MNRLLSLRGWLVACAAMVLLAGTRQADAEEEFERFLEALRRNSMYDMALEYLDTMRTSPLISPEIKETISYEEGVVLVEQSRSIRDMPKREEKLALARERFEQFVKDKPNHPQAAMANTQLGNVLVERGRMLLEKAKLPSQAANREKLREEAREILVEAQTVFETAETKFEEKVEEFPKGTIEDADLSERRRQARVNLIQSRLFTARVYEETSNTFEEGSDKWKEWLTKAADKYQEVYEKYRRWMAGLYAKMYLGNCHYKLGDTKQALAHFYELLDQPENPDFRDLRTKTLRLAMLCWTDESEQKFVEALKQSEQWVSSARPDEERSPEGLAIRWLSVVAADQAVPQIEDERQKERVLNAAAKNAQFVSKFPGEYQQNAKVWLVENGADIDLDAVTTFQEAYDRGREQLSVYQVAKEPDKKNEAREKALDLFRTSLELRNEDDPVELVNQVRYFITFLLYQKGAYFEAGTLGDFIGRTYPESSTARPGAYLAMVSWLQAYKNAPKDNREFENDQMLASAEYVTGQWPGQKESDQAVMILVDHFTRQNDLDTALEYLEKIPPDSPRRGEADLKAGQALWSQYLTKSTLPDEQRPPQADLDNTRQKAESTLQKGIERMRSQVQEGEMQEVGYNLLAAELSLSQMYLDTSRSQEAIDVLTGAKPEGTSVLAMVDKRDPVTDQGNFRVEAYKAALRAYVGTQQLDQAEELMSALDELVAESGDAASLTKIYISLGRSLQKQLEVLVAEGKQEEIDKVSKGFELFLDRIAQRPGNTYASLYWVAATFRNMGQGLDREGQQSSAQARAYYQKAADAFKRLLDDVKSGTIEARPGADIAVKIRLAEMNRKAGNAQEALDMLIEVLREKEKSLEAQVEAAAAYQQLGEENPKYYLNAMNGGELVKDEEGNQKYLVWGWNRLSSILNRIPRFINTYNRCRYNLVDCQYLHASKLADESDRRQKMGKVKGHLMYVVGQLEGSEVADEWLPKYDRLLRKINDELGAKHESLLRAQASR